MFLSLAVSDNWFRFEQICADRVCVFQPSFEASVIFSNHGIWTVTIFFSSLMQKRFSFCFVVCLVMGSISLAELSLLGR